MESNCKKKHARDDHLLPGGSIFLLSLRYSLELLADRACDVRAHHGFMDAFGLNVL